MTVVAATSVGFNDAVSASKTTWSIPPWNLVSRCSNTPRPDWMTPTRDVSSAERTRRRPIGVDPAGVVRSGRWVWLVGVTLWATSRGASPSVELLAPDAALLELGGPGLDEGLPRGDAVAAASMHRLAFTERDQRTVDTPTGSAPVARAWQDWNRRTRTQD